MTSDERQLLDRLKPQVDKYANAIAQLQPVFDSHPAVGDFMNVLYRELDLRVLVLGLDRSWGDTLKAILVDNPAASLVFLERLQAVYNAEFELLKMAANNIVREDKLFGVLAELRRL